MLPKKLSKEKQEHKIHETQDWIYAFQLALPIFFITLYYIKRFKIRPTVKFRD